MNGRTACTLLGATALLSLLAAPAAHADIRPSESCVERSSRKAAERESACYEMSYGGRTRTLRVYAPAAHAGRLPLLVVLHGGGGDGGGMEGLTRGGLNPSPIATVSSSPIPTASAAVGTTGAPTCDPGP